MDHHCLFLYTCIGYSNYKFFILTLFYGCILLCIKSITLIEGLKFYINEYGNNFVLSVYLVSFFLIVTFNCILLYFFYLHALLLIYNITTIEYIEKGRDNITKTEKNIFFISLCHNLKSVMGCFLLWFIPIRNSSIQNGYSFSINKETLDKLQNEKLNKSKNNK